MPQVNTTGLHARTEHDGSKVWNSLRLHSRKSNDLKILNSRVAGFHVPFQKEMVNRVVPKFPHGIVRATTTRFRYKLKLDCIHDVTIYGDHLLPNTPPGLILGPDVTPSSHSQSKLKAGLCSIAKQHSLKARASLRDIVAIHRKCDQIVVAKYPA